MEQQTTDDIWSGLPRHEDVIAGRADKMISVALTMRHLGVTDVDTVYRMIERGQLVARKLGQHWRVSLRSIYVPPSTVAPTVTPPRRRVESRPAKLPAVPCKFRTAPAPRD